MFSGEHWCDSWPPRLKRWKCTSPLCISGPQSSAEINAYTHRWILFQDWPNCCLEQEAQQPFICLIDFVSPLLILLLHCYISIKMSRPNKTNVSSCHRFTPFFLPDFCPSVNKPAPPSLACSTAVSEDVKPVSHVSCLVLVSLWFWSGGLGLKLASFTQFLFVSLFLC